MEKRRRERSFFYALGKNTELISYFMNSPLALGYRIDFVRPAARRSGEDRRIGDRLW